MRVRNSRPIPPELSEVRDAFESWRNERANRGRIPESLWASAVDMASQYGVCRVAKVLRLNVDSLKKRLGSSPMTAATAPTTSFVEVLPPRCMPGEFALELEDACGSKMRIIIKGAAAPDVTLLVDRFWAIES